MTLRLHVFWVTISFILASVCGCTDQCPPKPSSPGPLVTPQNGSDILRVGRAKLFSCCSAGFVNISWYFWQNNTSTWTAIRPVNERVQICNDEQVLQILHVTMKDQGEYRCLVTNGSADVGAYFELKVLGCDSPIHRPQVTIRPHNSPARLGDSVTLSCEGFFGCGERALKAVRWFSMNTDTHKKKLEFFKFGNHNNYVYTIYDRDDWDYVGANLTLDPVMKENFSQIFVCDLGFGVVLNATILHTDVTVKAFFDTEHIIIVSCACVLVVAMAITVIVCCWLHFPHISFWCNTKCNKFSKKGDFLYDTAVVCIEQDVAVVRERLLPMLKETLGYKVYFNPEDMPVGHGETMSEAGMFPKTYCAIMFVSKESLEENSFKFICQSATCLVGGPYMIVVKKEDIPKSVWKNVPRHLERRLKVIQTLTLPDTCATRGDKKSLVFWNSLQSKLPKPRAETRTARVSRDRASKTSSTVPLLSDENNTVNSLSQPV